MAPAPETYIFVFSTLIVVLLVLATWRHRHLAGGRAFLLFMLCAFIWSSGFTAEIITRTLAGKILMVQLQFIGITYLPLAWLYLVRSYTGRAGGPGRWILLGIVPTLTNIMIWLVPRPNWFWKYPGLSEPQLPVAVLNYDYGFWFYLVHVPYSYLLVVASLVILLRTYLNSHSVSRAQSGLMIIAIILPLAADMIYVLGYSPTGYNITTAVFTISVLIIAWSLYRYNFLDLVPVARHLVIENMEDGVIVFDAGNRIVDINPAAREITGISTPLDRPFEEAGSRLLARMVREISAAEKNHLEFRIGEEEEARVYDLRLSLIKDQSGQKQGSVVTLRDYTERARLFTKIHKQAVFDSLTGVYSRSHLFELAKMELSRVRRNPASSLSVIMLDLDNFKTINDGHGHATGDLLLKSLTDLCRHNIRQHDIFGRLGGDEFAIILPNTTLADALSLADRIRGSIEQLLVPAASGDISITVSLGVVCSSSLGSFELSLERLFEMADELMYDSKKQGGNQVSHRRERQPAVCPVPPLN